MNVLVTGGAGFIGSAFVRHVLERWPQSRITVLDLLTYAGNTENLAFCWNDARFHFVQGDICDAATVRSVMAGNTHVVNFAAETHVDRSILDPGAFVRTDVEGTRVLLEAARDLRIERYLQVSTDEVYGHIEPPYRTDETAPLRPRSPYAASKAGGDLMVGAYHATFDVPTLITRGANTYGPSQYPEKLIPLFVTNALDSLPLPVYGDGLQERDWLFVDDHCAGIATVLERGTPGGIYNVGVGHERPNLDIIRQITALTGADPTLIRHVADRPGHDRRYALEIAKVRRLGWEPRVSLEAGMAQTVAWYREHRSWWEPIKQGSFGDWYEKQYAQRLAQSQP